MKKLQKQVGFTLIELLVAMLIFGMLVGGVLAAAAVARRSARDTIRKGDLQAIHAAVQDRGNVKGEFIAADGGCKSTGGSVGSLRAMSATQVEIGTGNALTLSSSGLASVCGKTVSGAYGVADDSVCSDLGITTAANNSSWQIGYVLYNSKKEFALATLLENNSCYVIRVER